MKGSSFEQVLVLKKKNVFGEVYRYFTIYEHDSQWSINSRILMKLHGIGQLISEEKVFNNMMILYMYTT